VGCSVRGRFACSGVMVPLGSVRVVFAWRYLCWRVAVGRVSSCLCLGSSFGCPDGCASGVAWALFARPVVFWVRAGGFCAAVCVEWLFCGWAAAGAARSVRVREVAGWVRESAAAGGLCRIACRWRLRWALVLCRLLWRSRLLRRLAAGARVCEAEEPTQPQLWPPCD